jgi:hypothetical protein
VTAAGERRPLNPDDLRAKMEASLREEYGDEWMIEHAGLLDSQWDFLVGNNMV